jgi:hypothetical protein
MFLKKKKRPSLNEIEAVFRSELAPEFAILEKDRQAVLWRVGISFILLAPMIFFCFRSGLSGKRIDFLELIFGAGFAAGMFYVRAAQMKYRKEFKQRVMVPLAKRFFPELQYQPEEFVGKNFYDESDLFRKELSTYTGNDLFKGALGEVDFHFSELLCQYTTGSGKNKQTHTAFRGFLFVGDFHRDISFRTKIVPDLAESMLGVLGRGLQRVFSGQEEKLVDLENPEFEKTFKVTSGDQVEARFILTPAFMEKLLSFRKEVGNHIHLSFANGRMFLAVSTHHDYFEPNLFGEILSRKDLMKFIDMLILMTGIASELLHHPKFTALPNPPKMPPLPKRSSLGFIPIPNLKR